MALEGKKRKRLMVSAVLCCTLLLICFIYTKVCLKNTEILIPENELSVEVFSKVEMPEVHATYFGKDVTKDLIINDNIDNTKLGNYSIIYIYKVFGIYDIKKEINVSVVDTQAPQVVFDGGYICFVPSKGNYKLPEAIATDNYDSDCSIEYDNTIDQNVEGLQIVTYKACDKSNNCNYSALNVYVTDELNNEMFEKDVYKTTDYFTSAHEHQDFGDDNLYEYYFVGDSNIGMLQFNGYLPPEIVCAKACLSPNNIKLNITYAGIERDYNLFVLLETLQSKNILINIGQCQIDYSTIDEFIKQYSETLFVIKNNSAYPQIVVSEILPVLNDDVPNKPTNKEINIFNYHLAELCKNMGIKMITPGEVLKDENGNGVARYYTEDGYHLSREGEEVYLDYLKTHLPYPY